MEEVCNGEKYKVEIGMLGGRMERKHPSNQRPRENRKMRSNVPDRKGMGNFQV